MCVFSFLRSRRTLCVVWLWSAASTVDSSKDVWQKQECLGCSCSGTSMFQIYGGALQLCCTKQICAVL